MLHDPPIIVIFADFIDYNYIHVYKLIYGIIMIQKFKNVPLSRASNRSNYDYFLMGGVFHKNICQLYNFRSINVQTCFVGKRSQ